MSGLLNGQRLSIKRPARMRKRVRIHPTGQGITIAVKTAAEEIRRPIPNLSWPFKSQSYQYANENITRAVKKGTGELDSEVLEEIVYEGYAPAGVAVMLEITTDNRNRTAPDISIYFPNIMGIWAGLAA